MVHADERRRKKARTALVALTAKAGADSNAENVEQQILIGARVRSDVAERSGLLSGVAHTEGLAELPADLQPEDVQLWQTACVFYNGISTEELVTVIRVADTLGDSKLSAWTDLLCERVNATDWDDPAQADPMGCALISLPPHLLHAALTGDYACSDETCVWEMLFYKWKKIPPALHPGILAASVQSDMMTAVSLRATDTMHVLTRTTFPPPGLLHLSVSGEPRCCPPDPAHPNELSDASAAYLARALIAHPSLTTINFAAGAADGLVRPQWLSRLAACLPPCPLPYLSTLCIRMAIQPDACCALTRLLRHLPHLSALTVAVNAIQDPLKKPSLDPGASTPRTSTARVAALASLTELTLKEQGRVTRRGMNPVFSHMRLAPLSCAEVAPALLPLLHAPALTSASVTVCGARFPAPQLLSGVRGFTALQHLHVDVLPGDGFSRSCDAATACVLPALRTLEVFSNSASAPIVVTLATLQQLPPDAPLTRLALSASPAHNDDHAPSMKLRTPRIVHAAWGPLTAAIGRVTALQSLAVDVLSARSATPTSAPLAAALSQLTALTDLSLQSQHDLDPTVDEVGAVLRAADLVPALRQMQQLQRLRLCSQMVNTHIVDAPLQVLDACSVLGALTHLGVLCLEVAQDELGDAVERMRGVRGLDLLYEQFHSAANRDHFASRLPGVAVAVHHLHSTEAAWPDEDAAESEASDHGSSGEDF